MRNIDAGAVHRVLGYPLLIERLRQAFAAAEDIPERHHHTIPCTDAPNGTLLLMPAWEANRFVGVKIATVFPGNAEHGLPAVMGAYLLMDGCTGKPLAILDANALTVRRTAAASALAATYLAREDATRLLIVGAGTMAPHLYQAHCAVRPIETVRIWNRTPAHARRLADSLHTPARPVEATTDLAGAAAWADVISCATLSTEPLVRGAWLRPGTHLDLVGAFTPAMRETDDQAVSRAAIFVDTYAGALNEAGDLIQPLRDGHIARSALLGDLAELARGAVAGRTTPDQITLFKSVGTALEDLAAATLVYNQLAS